MPESDRFRYFEQGTADPISARAADLLACSPHLLDTNCLYRAPSNQQVSPEYIPLGTDARHFVRCRKGLRLHSAVCDKVIRDELCFILERCGIRTIAERPGSHGHMTSFRQRGGAFLLKTPHLVLPDLLPARSPSSTFDNSTSR